MSTLPDKVTPFLTQGFQFQAKVFGRDLRRGSTSTHSPTSARIVCLTVPDKDVGLSREARFSARAGDVRARCDYRRTAAILTAINVNKRAASRMDIVFCTGIVQRPPLKFLCKNHVYWVLPEIWKRGSSGAGLFTRAAALAVSAVSMSKWSPDKEPIRHPAPAP